MQKLFEKHVTKLEKEEKDVATNKAKEEEGAKKKAAADAERVLQQSRRRPAPKVRTYSVFEFEDKIPPTDVGAKERFTGRTAQPLAPSAPMIVPDWGYEAPPSVLQTLDEFMKDFQGSTNYVKSGRAAKLVSGNMNAVDDAAGCFRNIGVGLKEKLQQTERDNLAQPWHFGFSPDMKGAGPEFAFLAALKVQLRGDRMIIFSPHDQAREFAASKIDDASQITASKVVDCLCNAGAADVDALVKSSALKKCTVQPGSLLWIPWGWIVIEKSLNAQTNAGLRWLMVTEYSCPPFEALCGDVIPEKEDTKGNTALSFLVRVLRALYNADGGKKPIEEKFKNMESRALRVKMEQFEASAAAAPSKKRPLNSKEEVASAKVLRQS